MDFKSDGNTTKAYSRTESTSDLATEVAKKLMAKAGITGGELDFTILATITPDSMMPLQLLVFKLILVLIRPLLLT